MRLYDYAASGNCFKVRLLLGMLGREYERVPVDIFGGDTLTDAYFAINPLRETPVLELDDGTRIAQSSAILWYLAEGTPLLPADALGRAQVVQWLAFEQERVMGGLGNPRFRRADRAAGRRSAARRPAAARWRCSTRTSPTRDWVVGERVVDRRPRRSSRTSAARRTPGVELPPHVLAWMDRVRGVQGFVDDFVSYPDNARPGRGSSIYG